MGPCGSPVRVPLTGRINAKRAFQWTVSVHPTCDASLVDADSIRPGAMRILGAVNALLLLANCLALRAIAVF